MRSMTGYGAGEAVSDEAKVSVELTSVNRKQSDVVINLPRYLAELEGGVRKAVTGSVSRGRVSVLVKLEPMEGVTSRLQVDEVLAREYFDALARLGGTSLEVRAADLLRAPGVFALEDSEFEPETVEQLIADAMGRALGQLAEMQEAEGAALKVDLEERVGELRQRVKAVRELAPRVKKRYRTQLHKRLEEADIEVALDDERILKEIGLFAERCDISEELTRLESHFEQFDRYFTGSEPVGRALDFLCQEVNRELNTIGSKANDAEIAQHVVEAKTELEKIREQVQNVQ